jgi:hypothetical protein
MAAVPRKNFASYSKTALFLSKYSDDRNSPDLLFNGACGSEDNFQGSTAGDDMSLIADPGTVPLEEVTTSKAFNFKRIHSMDLYSKFAQEAKVEANHTYVVLGIREILPVNGSLEQIDLKSVGSSAALCYHSQTHVRRP